MICLEKRTLGIAFVPCYLLILLLAPASYSQTSPEMLIPAFRAADMAGNEDHFLQPHLFQATPVVPTPALLDSLDAAFRVGNFRFNAAGAMANYSFGSNYSQYGFGGGLLSSPLWGSSQLEVDAGFHHYSNTYSYMTYNPTGPTTLNYTENTSAEDFNAIYFWNQCDWRFGPTAGYHLSSTSYSDDNGMSYNSHAFNVGGYGQWIPECNFTGSAKAGYAFGDDSGYYAGLDIGYYFCPEFDLCGGYEYYGVDAWKVYSFRADYQVSQTTPFAISAGYELSAYPDNSTTSHFSIGVKYQWNVPTSTTLEDRNRTGLLPNYQFRF